MLATIGTQASDTVISAQRDCPGQEESAGQMKTVTSGCPGAGQVETETCDYPGTDQVETVTSGFPSAASIRDGPVSSPRLDSYPFNMR